MRREKGKSFDKRQHPNVPTYKRIYQLLKKASNLCSIISDRFCCRHTIFILFYIYFLYKRVYQFSSVCVYFSFFFYHPIALFLNFRLFSFDLKSSDVTLVDTLMNMFHCRRLVTTSLHNDGQKKNTFMTRSQRI